MLENKLLCLSVRPKHLLETFCASFARVVLYSKAKVPCSSLYKVLSRQSVWMLANTVFDKTDWCQSVFNKICHRSVLLLQTLCSYWLGDSLLYDEGNVRVSGALLKIFSLYQPKPIIYFLLNIQTRPNPETASIYYLTFQKGLFFPRN